MMFWLKTKKNHFQLHTIIWRPVRGGKRTNKTVFNPHIFLFILHILQQKITAKHYNKYIKKMSFVVQSVINFKTVLRKQNIHFGEGAIDCGGRGSWGQRCIGQFSIWIFFFFFFLKIQIFFFKIGKKPPYLHWGWGLISDPENTKKKNH